MVSRWRSGEGVLILSALLIAYFIWLIAKMGNVEEAVLDGVSVALDLPAYIEADPSLDTVSIEVRYPKSQRKDIHSGAFQVVVKDPDLLTQAGVRTANSVTVALLPDDVKHPSLPPSVQVERVEPARLAVRARFRTVPARVVAQFVDRPAPGYRLERVLVDQDERLLAGSQALLDAQRRNEDAEVELPTTPPVSLAGLTVSTKTIVAIAVPRGLSLLVEDPQPRLLHEVALSRVQVIIREEETTRTIAGIPIQVPTLARNLTPQTEPTSGSVTVVGPRSRVETLGAGAIQLRPKNPPEESPTFVGKIAVEAHTDEPLPPDVRIVAVRPDVVLLRYESKTTPTLTPP